MPSSIQVHTPYGEPVIFDTHTRPNFFVDPKLGRWQILLTTDMPLSFLTLDPDTRFHVLSQLPTHDQIPVGFVCKTLAMDAKRYKFQYVYDPVNDFNDIPSAQCATASVARVRWATEYMGWQPTFQWCLTAVGKGDIAVLQELRFQDPPNLSLDVLCDEACSWDQYACAYAADNGHIHVLQWLRSQDPPCPWNVFTCAYAAREGQLVTLQWLRSQDSPCPWDEYTCICAAENGNLPVLQWLRSQDPPCPWNHAQLMNRSNAHTLTWLQSQDP